MTLIAETLLSDPSEIGPLGQKHIDWLLAQGIDAIAIAHPLAIGAAKVLFDGTLYTPNALGEVALILPVIDHGLVDLVAWSPRSGAIGTRLGIGGCLGQGQIGRDGIGTHAGALAVHRDPLGWLRADRQGVVIADAERAAHLLSGLIVTAADVEHGRALDALCREHLNLPTIMIPEQRAAA